MQQIAVEGNSCRVRTETQPVGLNCPLVSISHRRASQFHYPRGQTPPRKQHDVSPLSDSGRREKYDGRGECDCRYMLQRSLNNRHLTSLRGRFRSSDFRSLNLTGRHNPQSAGQSHCSSHPITSQDSSFRSDVGHGRLACRNTPRLPHLSRSHVSRPNGLRNFLKARFSI
jgi:hypothetical protein